MIKLTNYSDGNQIHVRPGSIQIIVPHLDKTSIRLGGSWIDVKESAEKIISMIDGSAPM